MFKNCVLFAAFAACVASCEVTPNCTKREISQSYLDMAVYMITKARNNMPQTEDCDGYAPKKPMDCSELFLMGHTKSGVYQIWPANRITEGKPLDVFCEMETYGGGWTVIQRRGDFKRPIDYFYKDWKSYKKGFGDLERDFWLGNDNIFALSNQKMYSIRFDLRDVEGHKRYALYDKFWIDDEVYKYVLHISDYSGDAGDSMAYENNQKFSTKDQDNDIHPDKSCAQERKGAWWYVECTDANLNGMYRKGKYEGPIPDGIIWTTWKGGLESLEWTKIKIRPANFRNTSKIMSL